MRVEHPRGCGECGDSPIPTSSVEGDESPQPSVTKKDLSESEQLVDAMRGLIDFAVAALLRGEEDRSARGSAVSCAALRVDR